MLENPLRIGIDLGSSLGDMTVIQSPYCTEERLNFPLSRYRSKRLHKKLTKRLGPQRVRVPTMFKMMQNGREIFVAHPDVFRALTAQTKSRIEAAILGPLGLKSRPPEALTPFKLRQMALQIQGPVK